MKKLMLLVLLLTLLACHRRPGSLPKGFVYLEDHVPEVEIELRYFSSDNFVGDTIDGYEAARCIISREAAEALQDVQAELRPLGLGLKVFDAYRPQRAVDHFVRWAKDLSDTLMKPLYYPEVDKGRLFEEGYIAARSGHTRGSTVDLTLVYLTGDRKGQELDMGTPWDFFSPSSWPTSDAVYETQKKNRLLLQSVMIRNGFKPLETEWWHFTLREEPFAEEYFDFPVQ